MKKILALILSLCVVCTAFIGITLPTSAAVSLGYTGQCVWKLDGTVLTISGNGAMADHTIFPRAPWGTAVTSVIIEDGVTNIGNYSFYNCKNLKGISIPESVQKIGSHAFLNCHSLESVTIPDGVKTIGAYTFADCQSLTSIAFPDSVKSIAEDAFYNCSKLTSVTIPDSVEKLGKFVFSNCNNLKSVNIGSGIETIPEYAFRYCRSIENIDIPETVTRISTGAFYGCTGLKSIEVPDSVKRMDASVFYGCTSLTSASIGDSVRSISFQMFCGCNKLTDITLGKGVASISGFAFSKCTSLESIKIPDKVLTISTNAFSDCTKLKSITIPNRVKAIGDYVFFNCDSLKSVTLGNNVKSIGDHTFGFCENLVSLTIPKGVTEIGKGAFENCTSLAEKGTVYYCGSDAQWNQITIKAENDALESATVNNHNYNWVVDKQPTCAATGTRHEACVLCGATRSNGTVIPPTKKHTYKDTVVRPTASEDGYTIHTCTVCGDKYRDNFTNTVDGVKNMEITAGEGSLVVSWDKYSGATAYNVLVTDSKGNVVLSRIVRGGKTSTTLSCPTEIDLGKTYTIGVRVKTKNWLGTVYRDKALKTAGNSASNPASLGEITVNTSEVSKDKVTLSFGKVNGAEKYIVYLIGGGETIVKQTSKTDATLSRLKPNTTYQIKLQAKVFGTGYSKISAVLANVATSK